MKHFTEKRKTSIVDKFNAGMSSDEIKEKYGVPRSTLYSWRKQYSTIRSEDSSVTPRAYYVLKRHADKLELMLQILQSSDPMKSLSTKTKEDLIDELYGKYPVQTLCDAFNIPTATYYNHRLRNKNENAWFETRRAEIMEKIRIVEDESRHTYGVRRVAAALRNMGYSVSEKYVSSLMREMGILNPRKDTKKDYLKLAHRERRINKLKQCFEVERPNMVWVSDMTCFNLKGKRKYICVYLDLYSRKVVACRVGPNSSTNLALSTLRDAIASETPERGLVIHTDNGGAYISYSMNRLVRQNGFEQSFSRPGNPHDNAAMESFFSSLKQEFLYKYIFRSERELRSSLDKYIRFYNEKRLHEYLGYTAPINYKKESGINYVTASSLISA